jgi:SAM-dependent methyltransferase
VIHHDRVRASSFGDDAEQYDRARPTYPAELIDGLLDPSVRRVVDVGCGTGIASRLFSARGCSVTGVEADGRMASVARARGLDVDVAAFEEWDPPDEPFDLLVSGQAWHWIDPEPGAAKAAAVLRSGGRFAAFWNSYEHSPAVRARLTPVYLEHAPMLLEQSVVLGATGDSVGLPEIQAHGAFAPLEVRTYRWQRSYRRDEWLDQLPTHSDHRTMEPEALVAVLAGTGTAIDELGGVIPVDHTTRLFTAVRT